MGHEVEHRRWVVSAGGVHLHPASIHRLHLLVAGLGTDADAAADVLPRGFCHGALVVVHHVTGLIVARVFMVRAVCPHTVTGNAVIPFRDDRNTGVVLPPTHQVGCDGAGSSSDAALFGSYSDSLCPDLAGLFYLPDTYQLK